MRARPFETADAIAWDDFCASAPAATFLHTRRFLGYHGERFDDRSLVIEDARGRPAALFPAAVDPADAGRIVSHPGITYGGLLGSAALRGERALAALELVLDHYRAAGFRALLYKAVPHIYHRLPAEDDLYALFRLGAERVRVDLSATIDLARRGETSRRRRRSLDKARGAGVAVDGRPCLDALWPIVEENLARRHGTAPTHTRTDMAELAGRFPDNVSCATASLGGDTVAGLVLFETPLVTHAQYIASSAAGQAANALDLLLETAIARAGERGARWFDFGISNEDAGRTLNTGLDDFKREFGAGGVVHEFYEISWEPGRGA